MSDLEAMADRVESVNFGIPWNGRILDNSAGESQEARNSHETRKGLSSDKVQSRCCALLRDCKIVWIFRTSRAQHFR